jgi:mRNA turnover protein 4
MPKSKRNKVVSLTKVKRKGREAKEQLLENIHEAIEKFKHCFVLSFDNMRTGPFKTMQNSMRDSK